MPEHVSSLVPLVEKDCKQSETGRATRLTSQTLSHLKAIKTLHLDGPCDESPLNLVAQDDVHWVCHLLLNKWKKYVCDEAEAVKTEHSSCHLLITQAKNSRNALHTWTALTSSLSTRMKLGS